MHDYDEFSDYPDPQPTKRPLTETVLVVGVYLASAVVLICFIGLVMSHFGWL